MYIEIAARQRQQDCGWPHDRDRKESEQEVPILSTSGQRLRDHESEEDYRSNLHERNGRFGERSEVRPDLAIARFGVVTLTGSVTRLPQKLAAGEDARSAAGAWAVINHLTVDSGPDSTSAAADLPARVTARLHQNPLIASDRVRVRAEGSLLILEGAVGSSFERSTAERTAAVTPGVTAVLNDLILVSSESKFRNDEQLKAEIERGLAWDDRVGDARIDVSVKDGIVTVRGEVANVDVYDAILQNVFEALPQGVISELWRRQPAHFIYP